MLGEGSAIGAYQEQAQRMQRSHDASGSIQMNMDSLGVMDLDLSISPDVLELRAFNEDSPITRMLPGSTPCELRLMLPGAKLGMDGFHDSIIDNLTASPTWKSSHISPADITALCNLKKGHMISNCIMIIWLVDSKYRDIVLLFICENKF